MKRSSVLAFSIIGALLVAVITVLGIFTKNLITAFAAAPFFNILISLAFIAGVICILRRVLLVDRAYQWFRAHDTSNLSSELYKLPTIVSPLRRVLAEKNNFNATEFDAALGNVATRLDDQKEFSRYLANVVILLGLLGTFWGLLQTVGGVSEVLAGMTLGEGDLAQAFQHLKNSLTRPLSGMSISFSASLFGLASAILLGLFEVIATTTQNNFLTQLEDYLTPTTVQLSPKEQSLKSSSLEPSMLLAISETTTKNLEFLSSYMHKHEEISTAERKSLREFVGLLGELNKRIETDDKVLRNFAHNQLELKPHIERLNQILSSELPVLHQSVVSNLAKIEALLLQLTEETSQGRLSVVSQLKQEFGTLQRAISIAKA